MLSRNKVVVVETVAGLNINRCSLIGKIVVSKIIVIGSSPVIFASGIWSEWLLHWFAKPRIYLRRFESYYTRFLF